MPNEILTGARYPAASAVPNVNQDIQNAVQDLADNTVPNFTTAAARNTAFSSWVTAGNAMRDGLVCTVAGVPQVYRSSQWRGVSTLVYSGAAYTGAATAATFTTFVTVTVPDPGYPYQVVVDAQQFVLVSSGSSWNFTARIDSSSGQLITPVGSATSTTYVPVIINGGVSTSLSGTHAVIFNAEKISGAAGDGYQPSPVTNLQAYRVQVIPA